MVHHITLTQQRHPRATSALFQTPLELIIPIDQYQDFKKTIKVLFDKQSVKLIKRLAKR